MIIICDVDGVVADIHTPWIEEYNNLSGDNLKQEQIDTWHIADFVMPEWRNKLFDIIKAPGFYSKVSPIPGAREVIESLRSELGHRVIFASSCLRGQHDEKIDFLVRHDLLLKGRHTHPDFIAAADKSMLLGDLFVDDSMQHCESALCPAILFDQPWNRKDVWADEVEIRRADNWHEVLGIIENYPDSFSR